MLCLMVMAGGAGCYVYEPVQAPAPRIGEEVRVDLTGAGRDHLRDRAGLLTEQLAGVVLGSDATNLSLQVRLRGEQLGFGDGFFVDTLTVPRADIDEVGVKHLSGSRTAFAVAGAAGLVAAAFTLFSADEAGGGTGEPPSEFDLIQLVKWGQRLLGGATR